MKRKIITKSPKETQNFANKLAIFLIKQKKPIRGALVLALEGDLGGGKTTFLQGFVRGLGIKEKILSPTFVIMKKFKIQHPISNIQYLIHVDCYRINKPKEILDLDWKEIVNDAKNIVAIEWADRIQKILPRESIKIKFKFMDRKIRCLTISGL